jgi:chromosome segregation ATPase
MGAYYFRTELLGFSRDDVAAYLRTQGKKLRTQTAELETLRAKGTPENVEKIQSELDELREKNEELRAENGRLTSDLEAATLERDKLAKRLQAITNLLSEENNEAETT